MNSKIARRYSLALYEEAGIRSILDDVAVDALTVISLIDSSRELELFFKSPIIDKDKKQSIVTEIFEGKINKLSLHMLLLLVTRKREPETRNVFEDFLDLKNEKDGILKADVTTAIELNDEEKKKSINIDSILNEDEILISLKERYFKLIKNEKIGTTTGITATLDKIENTVRERTQELSLKNKQ